MYSAIIARKCGIHSSLENTSILILDFGIFATKCKLLLIQLPLLPNIVFSSSIKASVLSSNKNSCRISIDASNVLAWSKSEAINILIFYKLILQKTQFVHHRSELIAECAIRLFELSEAHWWIVTRLITGLESIAYLIPSDITPT